jgi:hypothetical protein
MEIITYFKVLPTDPRFQSLNLFQKIMLASGLRKDIEDKIEVGKNIFDKALLYINPEIWLKEKEAAGELPPGKYDKVNTEFKQIQTYGRATGAMPENTMIAKALKQAAALRGTIDPKDRLILRGDLDNIQEFSGANLPVHPASDPDELG